MSLDSEYGALRISASAGSGKTYCLTRLFLQRALANPMAYSGIVAITFTNKAANELKERIVKRLTELAFPQNKEKEVDLFGFPDREALSFQASKVLSLVLHDFDNLKVATIDSFFQSIFSQLAYEADLPSGLRTEVDLSMIKKEVLAEGIRSMGPEVRKVLVENLLDGLEETGKGWRTVSYLKENLLSYLFQEKVVDFHLSASPAQLKDSFLLEARQILRKYAKGIEEEIIESASQIVSACNQLGFSERELDPVKDKSFLKDLASLKRIAGGQPLNPLQHKKHKDGKWNTAPQSRKPTEDDYQVLGPLLIRYSESVGDHVMANLGLAKDLEKHLSSTRLLLFFRQVLKDQNHRANRFILGEIKFFLEKIIADSDVPYLFEKLGSQIHTLLIDEFQDTDKTQWKVLLPLARAISDNGGLFAVVGDVKQSIYAWRGADSSLFKEGLDKSLAPLPIKDQFLETNYRSESRIVDFNNWMFSHLAANYSGFLLAGDQIDSEGIWGEGIRRNYEDVVQKLHPGAKERDAGFVELRVRAKAKKSVEEESGEENSEEGNENLSWLIPEIRILQDAGFRPEDIAILVRKNLDIEKVLRILDAEKQKDPVGYDFTFSSAAVGKAGDEPLFQFLMLCLKNSRGNPPQIFEFVQMEKLAYTLGLDEEFLGGDHKAEPSWRQRWLEMNAVLEPDLGKRFFLQVDFFRLKEKLYLQDLIQEFQNLLFRYLQQELVFYPDFFEWWDEKASELEFQGSSMQKGIKVMTIHKSKGLDFGVVILPVFSTSTAESQSLHKADFWAEGEQSPWNAHPLLKGKASKKLLNSDLSDLYLGDVFRRAQENLNTLYVACTRPTTGLIIDITLDCPLEPNEKGSSARESRLAFQMPQFIREQDQSGNVPFRDYQVQFPDDGKLLMSFNAGEKKRVLEEKDEKGKHEVILQQAAFPKGFEIPWAEGKYRSEEAMVGILVHSVLEKTENPDQWEEVLKSEVKNQDCDVPVADQARKQLQNLFSGPEFRNWFSGKYRFYPEQQMVSTSGKILRADRLLVTGDELVLLDYKTGEESGSHIRQIMEYREALSQATSRKVEAYLVYSSSQIIRKVA